MGVVFAGPSYEKRIERRTITENAEDGGGGGALGNLSEGRLRIVKRAAKEFEGKRALSVQHLCLFSVSPLLCVFCCCWTGGACLLLRLMHGYCMDTAWILHGYCMDTAWILHGIVIMDE